MNEQASRISALITRFLNNELDEDGKKELAEWKDQDEDHRKLFDRVTNESKLFGAVQERYATEADIYNRVKRNVEELNEGETGTVVRIKRFPWQRMVAAAAIVLFVATGAYFMLFTGKADKQVTTNEVPYKNDVEPGTFKAKLTLADGSTIILDSAGSGLLAKQDNTAITTKDGKLIYDKLGVAKEQVLYNTLSTAKSETFSLMLSDGSRIWLNAESSITYPVRFTGRERNVEIKGEAYFEVAHSVIANRDGGSGKQSGGVMKQPFIVSVNGTQVEVLGTDFNINAYSDEAVIKTTLVEGKVKVTPPTTKGEHVVLNPGQQAQVSSTEGNIKVVKDANVDETIAWKNGMFLYERATIENIMKQVARWYNVEVVFEGKITQDFRASIPRNVPVSRLLKIFEMTGEVRFKVEGRKITVMPV